MKSLLSTSNGKLRSEGIASFGLPPIKTCPAAGECKKICYACKGHYRAYPAVKAAQERRLAASKAPSFVARMCAEITRTKPKYVRIHDSGDFYSTEYAVKWFEIAQRCPETVFYCYTKSGSLFDGWQPDNFVIIKSFGGLNDHLINPETDKHARIFETKQELISAGYVDCSKSDLKAIKTKSLKIGLIKH